MKKLRLLMVEDAASMRKFAKYGLEKSFPSIRIDEATNGKEAQAKLEQAEYDLILCDWEMPEVQGDELLEWVRHHPNLSGTPFIMVTSRNDKQSVMKAIELGANSYVVKPFTAESLARKITTVIDRFDRREHERYEASGSLTFHFRDHVARGNLIDISLGGLLSVFSRSNELPSIFEKVTMDLQLENSPKSNGIEGFVIRIQAAEAFIDADRVKFAVKFLDMSPEKKKELQAVLNSLRK
ncbi:MAG: response regulator [Nitrospirota bacterium]